MTIKKFKYLKEGTTEPKEYELLVINRDEEHENGISLSAVPEDQKEALFDIVKKYEEDLKPYMKYYRNFKKKCFVE